MLTMRLLRALLLLGLLVTPLKAADFEVLKNVQYVKGGVPDQTLDFYWPRQKPTATVLFIHGGSLLESGERRLATVYRDICRPFAEAGFGCANIDYRLGPKYKWPAMPQDVAAAVVSVRQLLASRGGNPDHLFLFGHSSGCHLAALLGADPKYLSAVGLTPRNLSGVIAMGCVLDRDDFVLRGITADQIRAAFAQDRAETDIYSTAEDMLAAIPSRYLGPHMPPTLVVVAENERFMPPILEQGARFVRRVIESGVPANLIVVPGKHMSSIADVTQPGNKTFAAISAFLGEPLRVNSR